MDTIIKNNIKESMMLSQAVFENSELTKIIGLACEMIIKQMSENKKLLICGNGGSAADAQHIASEFTGKYYLDRAPLNAEALESKLVLDLLIEYLRFGTNVVIQLRSHSSLGMM